MVTFLELSTPRTVPKNFIRLRNKRSIQLVCKNGGNEIRLTQEGYNDTSISKEMIASEFLNGGSLISDMACDKDDGSTKSVRIYTYQKSESELHKIWSLLRSIQSKSIFELV